MKKTIENEYRCDCGKLLFKGLLLDSKLEIKCKRCHKIKVFDSIYKGTTSNCDYSVVYGKDGKIIDASRSTEEYLGYSRDELKNLHASKINPLLSREIFEKTWELAAETENYVHWEACHKTKNGSRILVEAKINVYEMEGEEQIIFLLKILPESIDSKLTEKRKKRNIPVRDIIIELDRRGHIIYSSPETESILGYKPIEIFTKSIFDYTPQSNSDLTPRLYQKLVGEGKQFLIEKNAIQTKDGKIFKLISSFSPIFDERGDVWSFRGSHWIKNKD
jgi:PAS domain S-box-containing protein